MTSGIEERAAYVLAARSWPSIPDRPTVLVPVGSTEQHGPHLPLSTDTIIATAVARAVAARIGGDVVFVAPAVEYGASGEHEDFPGTVSIGADALAALLVELVRSLSRWASRIVLVNGHGGNVDTLLSVVPRMRGERHDLAWVMSGLRSGDAHAGRIETSLLLHLDPALVNVPAAGPGNPTPIAELMPMLKSQGVRALSPTGVLGDPTGASALEGATLFDEIVSDLLKRIVDGSAGPDGLLRLAPRTQHPTDQPRPDQPRAEQPRPDQHLPAAGRS